MNIQNGSKLNQLARLLPEGLIVDAAWLEQQGYSRALRKQYVEKGWLYKLARSVYSRVDHALGWEQVLISLQSLLHLPVSVGGRAALELAGHIHYLSSPSKIDLYSDCKLPSWVFTLDMDQVFVYHNRRRLVKTPKDASMIANSSPDSTLDPGKATEAAGVRLTGWGQWHWKMVHSTPERAVLEMIDELPNSETFHQIDVTMESLSNLNPNRLQELLELTDSVKVKRLFFFFADRHQHAWLTHIKREQIELGSGKRMLVRGGKLDPMYQITVPRNFV